MSSKPKSVVIKKSTKDGKKMMATFSLDNGRTKVVHFGQAGADDYTNSAMTAGALSRWILWNKETRGASITDYKRKFNL